MRINEHAAVRASNVVLVPYTKRHVEMYHQWMQDPQIRVATASDPLTLGEEYEMQQSWRNDCDKLTFIVGVASMKPEELVDRYIGDVNLFISIEDDDDEFSKKRIAGEVELMIAEKTEQGRGYGKATVLAFLVYVLRHEEEIVREFLRGQVQKDEGEEESNGTSGRRQQDGASPNQLDSRFDWFRVKIDKKNERSIKLFESMGFAKKSSEPNYFGEFELRRTASRVLVEDMAKQKGICELDEVRYEQQR